MYGVVADAEPLLGSEFSHNASGEGLRVTSYPAILDVPRELIWFVSRLLAAHRRALGTRKGRRSLTPCRQAVFGLAWFREKRNIPNLGRGFGLSQATSYNYINEIDQFGKPYTLPPVGLAGRNGSPAKRNV